MNELQNYLLKICQKTEVEAAFLGGSHSSGFNDKYSDLDFGWIIGHEETISFLVDELVQKFGEIVDVVDHKNLNLDVSFMKNKLASTEVLIGEFWKILEPKINGMDDSTAKLHSLKLYETPRNYVEYFGEWKRWVKVFFL